MKSLIAILIAAAFAVTAVQAGDACCQDKAACNAKGKTAKKADSSIKGAQQLVRK